MVARPATLCPPPRTATSRLSVRASLTASATSAVPKHRATTAGCLSINPLCTRRASSYPVSDGCNSCPVNVGASSAIDPVVDIGLLRLKENESQLTGYQYASPPDNDAMRIGIDLGGTKIEGIAIADDGHERLRRRMQTPRGDYDGTLAAVAHLVRDIEREVGVQATVGIGIPGAVSPATGVIKNA